MGAPEFKAEERRIAGLWDALAEDEKAVYEGEAAAMQALLARLADNLTAQSTSDASAALGPSRTAELNRHIFVRASDALKNHTAWSSGLGLCGPSTALRAEKVRADQNDKYFKTEVERLFSYDPLIIENPGTSIPHRSCHSKHWGVCGDDPLRSHLSNCTYNMYTMLQVWGLSRKDMPFVSQISVGDNGDCDHLFVVADTFGKGDTIFLCPLVPVPGDEEHGVGRLVQLEKQNDAVFMNAVCTTSQCALRFILLTAAASQNRAALTIEVLKFTKISFKPERYQRALALRLADEATRSCAIPLTRRLVVPGPKAKAKAAPAKAAPDKPDMPFGVDLDLLFCSTPAPSAGAPHGGSGDPC